MMDKSWYRRLFSPAHQPDLQTTEAKADAGDVDAQFRLGLKYANHEGTPDYAQAGQWYLKAADQNHALAQFNLGMMYAHGQGVKRDDARSVMWFRKAAQQGDAGAQYNLGMSHYRASVWGLPQDAPESRIEAYKWFHLAAEQGYHGSAEARVSVNLTMTREDVVEGNRRVAASLAAIE
jgi:uncharacterized protein